MKNESGIAMVQVLVMSVLLLILAAGVMQVIFGTHMLVAKTQASDKNRYWVEACMARLNAVWGGTPCAAGAPKTPDKICDFSSAQDGNGPPAANWSITCNANQVTIKLQEWPPP